jgi:hypothetical protein
MSWTGGTPTETSSANLSGQRTSGIGNGFSFDVAAGNKLDTLKIYVSGNAAGGILKAHLSNESTMDYEQAVATSRTNKWAGIFTILYNAGETNQTMNVSWIQSAGNGTFNLQAASVAGNPNILGLDRALGNSSSVQVYPNPYQSGKLTIKTGIYGNFVISIFDLTGKILYRNIATSSMVNIPNLDLHPGLYVVKVSNSNSVDNVKLVVK